MFDADAWMKALEAPTVTLNGITHVGRILSIEEWLPFAERFKALTDGKVTNAEFMTFAADYLRAVFPWKLSFRWRGDPVKELLKSPALVPTLTDFFRCQANALGLATLAESKTSGTDSPSNPSADT